MNGLLRRYARKALTNVAIPASCVIMVAALSLLIASDTIVRSTAASSEEAYFVVGTPPRSETFIIKLTDPAKIKTARDILSGVEKNVIGVSGTIVKSPACYNQPWSFHLDPESIEFFGVATEVCDATIMNVEDFLDPSLKIIYVKLFPFLPENRWCPAAGRLLSTRRQKYVEG